ncbi:MAG: hypothetical protein ACWA49_09565 [Ruegeria sp.]
MRVLLLAVFLAAGAPGWAQFQTAPEVKPILDMTKANWIAVREWQGEDWLYFTHLVIYRCAIEQVRYTVNDGEPQLRAFEPCYPDESPPFVVKMENGNTPYDIYPLGSIETITVEITLEDGTVLSETYQRAGILMP